MLEQKLSKIDFAGKDGFNWFVAQVTTDKAWRKFDETDGYRAKVRILGVHPPEMKDKDLPWAQFLTPANWGSGNNYGGQSFALQGGETVMGFFLDGDEGQQPVIFGSMPQSTFVTSPIKWEQATSNETSKYQPISFTQAYEYGAHIKLTAGFKPSSLGGFLNANNQIFDESGTRQETHIKKVNNEKIVVKKAQKCTKPAQVFSDAIKEMKGIMEFVERLEPTPFGYIDKIFNIPIPTEDFDKVLEKVSSKIGGALSVNLRLAKAEMMVKIDDAVDGMLKFTEPDFLLKKLKIDKSKNELSCLFENILGGLSNMIKGLLKNVLGKLVSLPLCAAENLLGGLLSNITDKISSAIGPALNAITGVLNTLSNPLGALLGGMPSLPDFSSMMKKAMGFAQIGLKLFSCEGQECEEDPTDWDLNVGPDGLAKPNIGKLGKIADRMNLIPTVEGIGEKIFPGLKNVKTPFAGISSSIDGFGTRAEKRLAELEESNPEAMELLDEVGGCDGDDGPFAKKCGPPKVVFFGGEGIGGAGKAVINEIGEIIGVSMIDMGFNFTAPPDVVFVDECQNGQGASGKAIIEDGKIVKVVMQESGTGYLGGGMSDSGGEQVIAVLDGIDVIGTGVGYEEGDTITTSDGQVLEPIIQGGRIIGANPIDVKDVTELPDLTINSNTGFGAMVRPILNIMKVEDYEKPILPTTKVIQVIDCVSSY
tara:strand:+ start:1820 stop:3934 length:2115 start_codon:yes stop_codon:yes gene_type:complete